MSNVVRFPPVHECEEIKKQTEIHLSVLRGENNLAAKLRARMAATVLSMIRPSILEQQTNSTLPNQLERRVTARGVRDVAAQLAKLGLRQ